MRIRRDFIFDPSLVLYLPLYQLDGASFTSKDAYGHLCTVIGASWRPSGRYFDGTDDRISAGNGASLRVANVSLVGWAKPEAFDQSRAIFGLPYDGGAVWDSPWCGYIILIHSTLGFNATINYGGTYLGVAYGKSLAANEWYLMGLTYDGATLKTFLNGEMGATSSTPSGDIGYGSPDPNFTIGVHSVDSLGEYFIGQIGDIWVYGRALSPLEMQGIYLATKWRYR